MSLVDIKFDAIIDEKPYIAITKYESMVIVVKNFCHSIALQIKNKPLHSIVGCVNKQPNRIKFGYKSRLKHLR